MNAPPAFPTVVPSALMRRAHRRSPLVALALTALVASPLIAQQADSTAVAASPKPASGWRAHPTLVALGAASLATVALAPFDKPISQEFTEPSWLDRRGLRRTADNIASFGSDMPFLASTALLAVAAGGTAPRLEQFAVHNVEAIALATVVTGIAKGVTGRALPGVKTDHAFQWGRGFHDANGPFVSFPSGHTAAAFAMASTISAELAHDGNAHATVLGDAAFGLAAAVGVARVAQRMHWPSDLPLAAFIGTWSGRVVQAEAHGGAFERVLRGLSVSAANGRSYRVGWSSIQ